MNVTSMFVVFSLLLFLAESPHKSLLLLVILLLLSFSLSLLLLPPLLFLSVFLRHSGMSPSTLLYLSRPPLPFKLSFFICVVLNAFLFESHACWEVSVNIFELVSADSFAGVSVGLSVSLCCCLSLTTHSLTFFSSFQADLSTAHSRGDEFF